MADESHRISDLAVAVRAVERKIKRRVRENGTFGDLTSAQVAVLARLEREGPATVSGLARSEGMRPQSMGATVAALEAAGLVSGTQDPLDGRQTIMDLTQSCRDRIAAARVARQDWLERSIQANLTAAEQKQLAASLALLNRILDT